MAVVGRALSGFILLVRRIDDALAVPGIHPCHCKAGKILNRLPLLHVRSPPHRVILYVDHREALPLPEPDRPRQKRMGVQVQTFNTCPDGVLSQGLEQCRGQAVAAVFGEHEQAHDFDDAFAVVIELAEAMVIGQVANDGDQRATISGFQKVSVAIQVGRLEMGQVFGQRRMGEHGEQLASRTVDEGNDFIDGVTAG